MNDTVPTLRWDRKFKMWVGWKGPVVAQAKDLTSLFRYLNAGITFCDHEVRERLEQEVRREQT